MAEIPAAQYLRMSTEHQQYSMNNQAAAIHHYAQLHSFNVVQTYADAGKSGVVLNRRAGLKQLLADVVAGQNKFKAILVYDVSRWGRFQDSDEAAHYEFLCKQAGVPVHYCAESFPNDGTLPTAILKALKRSMAGEFSRELGVKVFEGKKRLAQMGYRVGGTAGLGLRRMLVSADGIPKQRLDTGERKSLASDRTVLVPGPKQEVELVRAIFAMALRLGPSQIVRRLNTQGIKTDAGTGWRYSKLRDLLSNPKYIGCNAWARTSQRLRGPKRRLNANDWITHPGAFEAIVTPDLFDRVQIMIQRPHPSEPRYTDNELLQFARDLVARKGRLSQRLITAAGGPAINTYLRRLGGLQRVYQAIGYRSSPEVFARISLRRKHQRLREELVGNIVRLCPGHLSSCHLFRSQRQVIIVDGEFYVLVTVCKGYTTKTAALRWQLIPPAEGRDSVVLLCLSTTSYRGYRSFFLVPGIDKERTYQIKSEADPLLLRGRRLDRLAQFYQLAREVYDGQRNR